MQKKTVEKSIRLESPGTCASYGRAECADMPSGGSYGYYRMLAELSEDLIFIFDADGTIRYVNNHAAELAARKTEDLTGANMKDLFCAPGYKKRIAAFRKIMKSPSPVVFEERLRMPASRKWLHTKLVPALNESGVVEHIIEISRDIDEKKKDETRLKILNRNLKDANRELRKLAFRDAHTGLYNLHNLKEVVEKEFQRTLRQGKPFAIIMMDIDYFKSINDVFGHIFGDTVLKQLAGLIQETVRKYDIVFRYGGEEFTVIAPGADRVAGMLLARRLLEAVNSARFGDSDHKIGLKMSLAVSSYPEDEVAEGMDLVRTADSILKTVKEYGGNRACSSAEIDVSQTAREMMDDENAEMVKKKIKRLSNRVNHALVKEIVSFVEKSQQKVSCFSGHSGKVRDLALGVASHMNLSDSARDIIGKGARVYDVGKTGISGGILEKKGKWNSIEADEFKAHVDIGADIIKMAPSLAGTLNLVKHHHEKWDGSGYPSGHAGNDIPLEARIISVCDAYAALISSRPYREDFTPEIALGIMKEEAGTKYDPQVVGALEIFLSSDGIDASQTGKIQPVYRN